MRLGLTLKWGVLGLAVATLVLLAAGTKPVRAGPGPLPFPSGMVGSTLGRLISCPNYVPNGADENLVNVADVSAVVNKYRKDYPDTNYWFLMDAVGSLGQIRVDDVSYVVNRYRNTCPAVDTQIAKATQALANPGYTDKLCDEAGNYTTAVNCGGDIRFLTEHAPCIMNDPDPDCGFLAGKGYRLGSSDVPGQGSHYINYAYWNGIFNPVRPPGLVYKSGRLAAQLYYAAGDSGATMDGSAGVGWASVPNSNVRAVHIDALCTPVPNEPSSIGGCSWSGSYDGFHWHANLCTVGVGTLNALAFPMGPSGSQGGCGTFGQTWMGHSCTFAPAVNFDCAYADAVGWMGHLWNWYPNANFTNVVNPGPGGLGDCQAGLCSSGESNGRFADCFPDGISVDTARGAHVNGAIVSTDTTININTAFGGGLAASGFAYISDGAASEYIYYTGNSGTQLSGVVRGVWGTSPGPIPPAIAHASGTTVDRASGWSAYSCPQ